MATTAKGPGYELTWREREVLRDVDDHLTRGVAKATQFVVREVKKKLNRGQPTRGYTSKKTGKYYRVGLDPSRPRTPPKKVTARLFQSIKGVTKREDGQPVGYVGTNVEYGRALELGYTGRDTKGRRRNLAARPYLRPVVLFQKDKIKEIIIKG